MDYSALLDQTSKALFAMGIRVVGSSDAPVQDQAYRMLMFLDALALRLRMFASPDVSLSVADRTETIAETYAAVTPLDDSHIAMAGERVAEALALLHQDAVRDGEGSLFAVTDMLLSAAGLLLSTVLTNDVDGTPVMDGEEPVVIPSIAAMYCEARERVREALHSLEAVTSP